MKPDDKWFSLKIYFPSSEKKKTAVTTLIEPVEMRTEFTKLSNAGPLRPLDIAELNAKHRMKSVVKFEQKTPRLNWET
jgi:hypothetical protein